MHSQGHDTGRSIHRGILQYGGIYMQGLSSVIYASSLGGILWDGAFTGLFCSMAAFTGSFVRNMYPRGHSLVGAIHSQIHYAAWGHFQAHSKVQEIPGGIHRMGHTTENFSL